VGSAPQELANEIPDRSGTSHRHDSVSGSLRIAHVHGPPPSQHPRDDFSQQNAWIHAVATMVVAILGALLGLSISDWCRIVLAVVAVWTAEALNTAFRAFHALAGKAMGVAAGVLLISAMDLSDWPACPGTASPALARSGSNVAVRSAFASQPVGASPTANFDRLVMFGALWAGINRRTSCTRMAMPSLSHLCRRCAPTGSCPAADRAPGGFNMRRCSLVFVLGAFLHAATVNLHTQTASEQVATNGGANASRAKTTAAVVLVSGTDSTGALRSGAGFVVDASGTVVTNLHTLRGLTKASVHVSNGDVYEIAQVRAFDQVKDLAIVQIPAFGLARLELGDSETVTLGAAVSVLSIPLASESHPVAATISKIQRAEGFRVFHTTSPLDAANSGGPLLDDAGRVIGVIAIAQSGEVVGLPVNYVRGLLTTNEKLTLRDLAAPGLQGGPSAAAAPSFAGPTGAGPSTATNEPATVVFYRLRRFNGYALEPSVYCDEKELATMDNGRYFKVQLPPGTHVCRSNDQSVVSLDLQPGETRYVRIEIATGLFKGHGAIAEVPKGTGAVEITRLKPLDESNVRDPSVFVK
jgi:S1-C subfamily serine protease